MVNQFYLDLIKTLKYLRNFYICRNLQQSDNIFRNALVFTAQKIMNKCFKLILSNFLFINEIEP